MNKLLILALGFSFFGCNMAPKVDYVVFSGKVENPSGDKVRISRTGFSQDFPLSEDGSWSDTLRVEAGYYRFDDTKESSEIYLAPGYNLYMTLNTDEFDESIRYEGPGSETNNYLAVKYLLIESSIDPGSFYKMDETQAQGHLDELSLKVNELLAKQEGLSAAFLEMEKRNVTYSVEWNKILFGYYHGKEVPGYEPSEEFMASINAIDYTREDDYLNHATYKELVSKFHERNMKDMEIPQKISYIKGISNPSQQSNMVRSLNYQMTPGGEYNYDIAAFIMELSDDDKLKGRVTDKAKALENLVPGNPSPQFSYEDINGETVSLEDFRGKYVYLDVWATWCGPCVREIPHLKSLEEEYRGRNIAFVGVSIDDLADKEKWMNFVVEKELVGTQVFADSDWSSEWVKSYAIYSIPRFILLDTEGNIIDAMAPRPSNKEGLDEIFAEYSI